MLPTHNPVYINTVLLEKNRWGSRIPSLAVSNFMSRFRADGLDGVELWENHAVSQQPSELAAIQGSGFPVPILNSYAPLTDEALDKRRRAAEVVRMLNCRMVKFNFGNDPALIPTYKKNLRAWKELLPAGCRLLCECHAGTVMEDPAQAAAILADFDPESFPVLIHPFDPRIPIATFFQHLGPRVAHTHLSIHTADGVWHSFRPHDALVRNSVAALKRLSYAGSLSLEFTSGTNTPDETPEKLYQSALDDLSFIKDCLRN